MMSFRTKTEFLHSLYLMKMKQKKEYERKTRVMEEIRVIREQKDAEWAERIERSRSRSKPRSRSPKKLKPTISTLQAEQ